MMASILSWFGGAKSGNDDAKEAIVKLRQHVNMLDKKEDYLNKKIEEEEKKIKANLSGNRRLATDALKRKKQYEDDISKIYARRNNLEKQRQALEDANMNMETVKAMKEGASALKRIHGKMSIDKVDSTMDEVNEQIALSDELSNAISQPTGASLAEEQDLEEELKRMEQEELDAKLSEVGPVPESTPPSRVPAQKERPSPQAQEEDPDDEELRQLKAALAS